MNAEQKRILDDPILRRALNVDSDDAALERAADMTKFVNVAMPSKDQKHCK